MAAIKIIYVDVAKSRKSVFSFRQEPGDAFGCLTRCQAQRRTTMPKSKQIKMYAQPAYACACASVYASVWVYLDSVSN